jgi:hypothetical protein
MSGNVLWTEGPLALFASPANVASNGTGTEYTEAVGQPPEPPGEPEMLPLH